MKSKNLPRFRQKTSSICVAQIVGVCLVGLVVLIGVCYLVSKVQAANNDNEEAPRAANSVWQ